MAQKTFLITIVCIISIIRVTAQSQDFYRDLSEKISVSLQDSLLKEYRYFNSFSKDSSGTLAFGYNNGGADKEFSEKITQDVFLFQDSLHSGEHYFLSVYWDLYSNNIFTTVMQRRKHEGFPNFNNYYTNPKIALYKFYEQLVSDIRRNYIDSIHSNLNWNKPIEIYVDIDGKYEFLTNNNIVQLLDSVTQIGWTPSLYYAKPIGSIFSFRLDRSIISKPYNHVRHVLESEEIFVLEPRYHNSMVRIQESKGMVPSAGDIVVSYVLNPTSNSFESPMIHRGPPSKARLLIDWIDSLHIEATRFCWIYDSPIFNRYFFYIVSN